VIAISSDQQSFAWSIGQTTGARFEILSDADRKVITSYGILNPAEHGGIAHPAIFIVDRDGKIKFLHVGKDPQDRPPDQTIIEEVKKLVGPK
jgi:peroxiredoxin